MSEILKPLMLDETGKAIVEALTQQDMTQTRIAEINTASNTAKQEIKELTKTSKQSIETKTNEQLARIPEVTDLDEAVNQLKDDVTAITPDDTVVDGKPWTSKKTVDSLCMPLEATGNPVKVYPVEGYPLGVKVSWEPVQEGEGDPSPDNIRPITGRDAVSVTRCGKNLLCPENKTQNQRGIKWTESKDGSFRIEGSLATEGTATAFYLSKETKDNIYAAIKSGINLSVSGIPTGVNIAVYDTNWVGAGGKTLKFPSGMGYPENTYFEVRYSSYTFNGTYYPQIEVGSTATPYEPYTGSTTDISLPETVYGGTLDVETGVVTVDRQIIIADGTVNKFSGSSDATYWNMPENTATGAMKQTRVQNSHFKKEIFGTNDQYGFIFAIAASIKKLFATADDLNAYLVEQNAAGTPVTFVYELKTPYTIQLTPRQIAALSGTNTIYTDTGTLTVTGREDPRHTIVTLTDRIAALESAAAGV